MSTLKNTMTGVSTIFRSPSAAPAQREQATLQVLTQEVIKTSEIEGERLNLDAVRSSRARRLGVDIGTLAPAALKRRELAHAPRRTRSGCVPRGRWRGQLRYVAVTRELVLVVLAGELVEKAQLTKHRAGLKQWQRLVTRNMLPSCPRAFLRAIMGYAQDKVVATDFRGEFRVWSNYSLHRRPAPVRCG